jgi:hypothetical protein
MAIGDRVLRGEIRGITALDASAHIARGGVPDR